MEKFVWIRVYRTQEKKLKIDSNVLFFYLIIFSGKRANLLDVMTEQKQQQQQHKYSLSKQSQP